jgi:hypothetical protein
MALEYEETPIGSQALVPGVAPKVPALIDSESAVKEYRDQAAAILLAAKLMLVTDAESKGKAVTYLGRIATIIKKAETARRDALKPAEAWKERLTNAFRDVMLPVTQADTLLRDRVLSFDREQRVVATEKARQAAITQQAAIDAKRAADAAMQAALAADAVKDTEAVSAALDKAAEADQVAATHTVAAAALRVEAMAPRGQTVTEEAKSTTKKTWEIKIVDAALVPNSLKVPDEKAIRALVILLAREGQTAAQINARIPGIEAYQKESLAVQAL